LDNIQKSPLKSGKQKQRPEIPQVSPYLVNHLDSGNKRQGFQGGASKWFKVRRNCDRKSSQLINELSIYEKAKLVYEIRIQMTFNPLD
jgi:hypothetical protein